MPVADGKMGLCVCVHKQWEGDGLSEMSCGGIKPGMGSQGGDMRLCSQQGM